MRDFCNVAERDCIRLIVAQDLKENGIDLDAQQQQSSNKAQKDHTINKSNISTTHDPDSENRRVFGVQLKNLEMMQVKLNDQLLSIPVFLKYAIDHISQYIHVEGIFRRNGTATRLRELKKQVEEGQFNFPQYTIFDVTSLIKLFFRELPESLLTFALYNCFIQAIKLDSSKAKFTILNLCLQLPDVNLHTLIYLMTFLKAISIHESDNKMNSFNLAVCFAPNIIYTRINKINELYINEERMVIQFLIENSSLIGKISDSVYERSLMLTSLCCSDSKDFDAEQESFATARSTSLSSYCNNKKEKKKRRSSSLKELMTTIQNSISKFRRRSASEKNDKTTCSVMSTDTSTRIVNDDKSQMIQATPYKLLTPISTNIYTPRIKRNAEESLQSTTKKKLLEKLPQRNLLPNAPVTPFSTTKKNKHPFKLLGSENKEPKFAASGNVPSISLVSSSISCVPTMINCISTPGPQNCLLSGPSATPLNVVNLQKQLKYDDSPSALFAAAASASINPIYDSNIKYAVLPNSPATSLNSSNFRTKSQHMNDKNLTIASGELSECRRRLEMTNNENSKYGNYNHYHGHHHSHHHYYNTASHSHHSHLSSKNLNSNRYINQSDICSSNNLNLNNLNDTNIKGESNKLSTTTTCTSHLHSTSDYLSLHQRTLTDSMRCTLKRGRPNTPKTGLSMEYRTRKSSVHTTPELHSNDVGNRVITKSLDDDNLNNAIIQIDDDELNNNIDLKDGDIMNNPLYSNMDDLNDARLDEALVGDELEADDCDDEDEDDDDDDFEDEKSKVTVDLDGIEPINTSTNEKHEAMDETNKTQNTGDVSVLSALPIIPNSNLTVPLFDPTLFKMDSLKQHSLKDLKDNADMLRRQSLFKLKEKMNGRVSKQINEIEKRKLSPYRFSNSPLKRANTMHKISPVRVPTVYHKSLLKSTNLQEQFKFKRLNNTTGGQNSSANTSTCLNTSNFEVKLPTDSNLLARAANEFNKKKLTRNKSVKRLNNSSASPLHNNKSLNGSPISKSLIQSTQLNCASESFDF